MPIYKYWLRLKAAIVKYIHIAAILSMLAYGFHSLYFQTKMLNEPTVPILSELYSFNVIAVISKYVCEVYLQVAEVESAVFFQISVLHPSTHVLPFRAYGAIWLLTEDFHVCLGVLSAHI